MDKRSFPKKLPLIAGGLVLSQQAMVGCSPKANSIPLKNWAGNLTYSTDKVHYPSKAEEVQASLPHITVIGACATATHGSGIKNSNLSSSVSAIEFVDASGQLVTL